MTAVATSLKNVSTTESSNGPDGTDNVGPDLDLMLRVIQAVGRQFFTSDTIASAGTCDIGSKDAGQLAVSGTTTITAFGTVSAGIIKILIFDGALTLTYNATSLILPTAANITTAAGDVAVMESKGSGNWKCLLYQRANGIAVGVPTLVSGQFLTNSGTALQWADPTVSVNISAKSGTYTVVAGDRSKLISCTSTFTLTLTAAATLGAGWSCYVENAGTGIITLSCSTNIDSIATSYLMYPGERRLVISDGTDFKTILMRGGSYTVTAAGAASFKAPPGVQRFEYYAVAAGAPGSGNGITAGAGGRGGTGVIGSATLTAGTTYSGGVGDGTSTSINDQKTYLTNFFDTTDGGSSSPFNITNNPNAEGIFLGGAGGAAGPNGGKPCVYGGGGGGGGNDGGGGGTGGASQFAGAGGATGTAGTAPGGGGGGGDNAATVGQAGGNGMFRIWW